MRSCSKAWVCEPDSKTISWTSLEGLGTNPGHENLREHPEFWTQSPENDDPSPKQARRTQDSAGGLLRSFWLFLGLLGSHGAKHSPSESRSHRRRFAIICGLGCHFCVLFGFAVLFQRLGLRTGFQTHQLDLPRRFGHQPRSREPTGTAETTDPKSEK